MQKDAFDQEIIQHNFDQGNPSTTSPAAGEIRNRQAV
jgi:hypothetical protein